MVKKIIFLISLCLSFSLVSFADSYLVDDADIFSNDAEIEEALTALTAEYGIPVYLLTTDKEYTMDAMSATDYLLADRVGFNHNGMLLSINMASRDVNFTTSGPDLQADKISDKQIHHVHEKVGSYLHDGNFDQAAMVYCDLVRDIFRGNYLSGSDMVIAFFASLFGAGSYGAFQFKKYKPKPRRKQNLALAESSCVYAVKEDKFISERTVVTTKPKPVSSSSSSTSHTTGGGSFRGGGSKF